MSVVVPLPGKRLEYEGASGDFSGFPDTTLLGAVVMNFPAGMVRGGRYYMAAMIDDVCVGVSAPVVATGRPMRDCSFRFVPPLSTHGQRVGFQLYREPNIRVRFEAVIRADGTEESLVPAPGGQP